MDSCLEHLDLSLHTPDDSDRRVWHFNVAFIGSCRVGKTKLLMRFVDSQFSDIYSETAETSFVSKSVSIGRHHVVYQCWDTPGSIRTAGSLDPRLTQLHAIFIVFDVSRDAVADLEHWHHLAFSGGAGGSRPLLVLVANKTDLGRHDDSLARARQLASAAPGGGLMFALSVRTDEENLEVDAMMLEVGKALTERHSRDTAAAAAVAVAAPTAVSAGASVAGDRSDPQEAASSSPSSSLPSRSHSIMPTQRQPTPMPPPQPPPLPTSMPVATAGDAESERNKFEGDGASPEMAKAAKVGGEKGSAQGDGDGKTCWERVCCCLRW